MEEKKPSIDPGLLAPGLLGLLSVVGIAVIFFLVNAEASRPTAEPVSTATQFRFIYMGTEPSLSTLTPQPTPTRFVIETPEEPATQAPFLTLPPTQNGLPTQPAVRTPTRTPTIPALLLKVDDTYFELLYNGDWVAQSNVTGTEQNTLHISFRVGNSMNFTFVGQQVVVSYQAGPSLGSIRITLDGLEFDVSQATGQTQLVDWRSPILVRGTHELVIEHLSGGSVNLDSIAIPDLSTPVPTSNP